MRRRPAIAPKFNLTLPTTDGAQETKREEKDVTRKEAESLIVDLDAGTMDSPYIATSSSGHFPGAGGDSNSSVGGGGGNAPRDAASSATAPAPPPRGGRKFFRVDESNLFVFVNERENDKEDDDHHGGTPLEALAGNNSSSNRSNRGGSGPQSQHATTTWHSSSSNEMTSPQTAPPINTSSSTTQGDHHQGQFPSSRSLFEDPEELSDTHVILPSRKSVGMTMGPKRSSSESDLMFGFGRKFSNRRAYPPSFGVDGSSAFPNIDSGQPQHNYHASTPGMPPQHQRDPADIAAENIKFEDLEMLEHLGTGAQGTVRSVRHQGKNYALKKISVSDALDRSQADVERQARKNGIVRELQMVANRKNRSPYVVALHNAYFRKDSERGNLHILMEKMSISLEDLKLMLEKLPAAEIRSTTQRCFGSHQKGNYIDSRVTPLYFTSSDEVASKRATSFPDIVLSLIANDALQGLKHFDKVLKMVHTDIKPANLMLSENLELIKIADFGCSQVLRPNGTALVNNVLLGTKLYMSPERAEACYGGVGGEISTAADVWAVGIMLLELASGIHPCEEFKEEYWDYAPMLTWKNMIKPESTNSLFCEFVQLCLTVDPAKRPSAETLLNHDFIAKYRNTPRRKLTQFVNSIRTQSQNFERTSLNKMIFQRMITATNTMDRDRMKKQSQKAWQGFKKGVNMGTTPDLKNEQQFPALGAV